MMRFDINRSSATGPKREILGRNSLSKVLPVVALALVCLTILVSTSVPKQASGESVGSWTASSTYPLHGFLSGTPEYGVASQSCDVSSSIMYCVGGGNYYTGDVTNLVYYSSLSSSGFSTWTNATQYPIPIKSASCSASGGYLYCVGGTTFQPCFTAPCPYAGPVNSTYYAPISGPGLGAWQSTTSYPVLMETGSCVTSSGYIYCVGGDDLGTTSSAVYYAPISSSGIGPWKATTSYPVSVYAESCLAYSGYIFCIGGDSTGLNGLDSTYYAPLSASGVGSWTNTTNYPTKIESGSCTVSSGYVYCIGGRYLAYPPQDNYARDAVYYTTISSSGLGGWVGTTSYPVPDSNLTCGSSSGYLYCLGGEASGAPDEAGRGGEDSRTFYTQIAPSASTSVSTSTVTATETSLITSTITSTAPTSTFTATTTTTLVSPTTTTLTSLSATTTTTTISTTSTGSVTVTPTITQTVTGSGSATSTATQTQTVTSTTPSTTTETVTVAGSPSTTTTNLNVTSTLPAQTSTTTIFTTITSTVATVTSTITQSGAGISSAGIVALLAASLVIPPAVLVLRRFDRRSLNPPFKMKDLRVVLVASLILLVLFTTAAQPKPANAESVNGWTSSTAFPEAGVTNCVTYSGYVYCISTATGDAYYAPLSAAGVGSWSSTILLPSPVSNPIATCVAYAADIYCLGNGTNYFAQMSSSGVGPWSTTTGPPQVNSPDDNSARSCSAYSGYMYCVGGTFAANGNEQYINSVIYAPISGSGIGAWQNTTSYPIDIQGAICVTSSGYIYCIGGTTDGQTPTLASYFAPVSPSGVGAWQMTVDSPLVYASPYYGPEGCFLNSSYVYCIDSDGSVYFSPTSSTGLGGWTGTMSYPLNVEGESCVSDSYLYCIAGFEPGPGVPANINVNDTYYTGLQTPQAVTVTTTVVSTAVSTSTSTVTPTTTSTATSTESSTSTSTVTTTSTSTITATSTSTSVTTSTITATPTTVTQTVNGGATSTVTTTQTITTQVPDIITVTQTATTTPTTTVTQSSTTTVTPAIQTVTTTSTSTALATQTVTVTTTLSGSSSQSSSSSSHSSTTTATGVPEFPAQSSAFGLLLALGALLPVLRAAMRRSTRRENATVTDKN
ncbi:MAG: hypothetical protein OK455_04775 [Thaumarchaeota archaeon]|nr:hypothetical protein [Nitrososphaerota archaeon]